MRKKNFTYGILSSIPFFLIMLVFSCDDDDENSSPEIDAQFQADTTTIIQGNEVTFEDISTGNPTSWQWTFEGGSPATSTAKNPTVSYGEIGEYSVRLTVLNGSNLDSLVRDNYITVVAKIEAAFKADITNILQGATITFNDESTGNPTNWQWTFEGGTPATSTEQNPTISYETPGEYKVSLTAFSGLNRDSLVKENYIIVVETIGAFFQADTTRILEGEMVTFEDNSIGEPTSWQWTFEGGTPATSTEQNPIITYDIPGTYSVSLTIMKEGEEITLEKENYIEVAEKIKTAFTVNANSSPTIIEGSTITFNDESTGNPTNWQWFFEGGTPATSTEQNPTITYATPGIYNVQLKSSNDVHADSLLKEDFITVRSAFEAQFEADTTFVLEGREVKFTDNSTGEPTSWDWTFEGGTPESSTEQNPTVTYATAGNYNVSLKITKGNEQKTEEKTNYINVFQQVAAQFEADTTRIVEREFMSFEDNSIGEPTSWEWNFEGGDPETSTEQNPMVSYQSPGTYNVRLIVRNRVSSDTLEKAGYVTILDKVVASFLPTNTSVTENNAITFNDNSAGEPTSWEWTFEGGNPATSTEQNPQVTYATSGIYDVTLRVSNEFQSDIIQRNEYISVLEKSLVASYTLDNGSAIDEGDIGGFNGALNGPTAVPDRNAVANSALSFDGVNDRVETSNLIDDNLKAGASFAAWIYVSNLSSSRTIISNYNGTGAPGDCNERIGFNFRVLNDGKLNVAYITDGNDRVGRLSSVGDISINTWYHVVGTWDGNFSSSGFKLYIDGVQKDIADDKIGNICGIYMRESVQPFFIGDALCSTGFCAPFSGVVDEVKIYNYPLTENEIQTLSGL